MLENYFCDEGSLLIREGHVKISPRAPVPIGCYPTKPSSVSDGDIEANFIWLKSGQDQLLIVSIDALYVGAAVRATICDSLEGCLTSREIFVAASHTHNAPHLDTSKPTMAPVDLGHLDFVQRQISALLQDLKLQEWRKVTCESVPFFVSGVVQRRRKVPKFLRILRVVSSPILQLPNYKANYRIGGVTLFFSNGTEPVAALAVMPCHPVAYPSPDTVSADYVGPIRSRFRDLARTANRPATFVFLQGASGDLNPDALETSSPTHLKQRVFRFLFGKPFGRFSRQDYECWSSARALESLPSLRRAQHLNQSESESQKIFSARHVEPLDKWFSGELSRGRELAVHMFSIGGVAFLGISAEPTWELGEQIKSLLGGVHAHIVGCIDDTYGYLPTQVQWLEGGYEAHMHLSDFDLNLGPTSGGLAKHIQQVALELVSLSPFAVLTNNQPREEG